MTLEYEAAKEGAWETEVASTPIQKKDIRLVGQELGEVKDPACLLEEKLQLSALSELLTFGSQTK